MNDDASARSAQRVAAGILFSRVTGLVRDALIATFLGTSYAADAFRAALRMPNVLQNLLGEGTLSASFIPVYSELLEEGREEEAGRVAGAIFALLFAVSGGLALLGILLAPVLVAVFTPGFVGEPTYDLTVTLVRIIFPMTGVLVLSAWCLGVLNSHRRFFLPYVAPVLWNAAMIAGLLLFGFRLDPPPLAEVLAWSALIGGVLQFGVQLPGVLRLERSLRIRWDLKREGVRTAVRNAGPAIAGRGVVQLSGYIDLFLASFLATGAVAILGYAQPLYMLPVSLFGMSVAAAELPELARERKRAGSVLRDRVNHGLRRMAFYIIPSILAFLVLGDVLVGALYQRGEFSRADTLVVAVVLAGYAVGLLASTGTRLFSSAYFALHDTKTPARTAALRAAVSAVLGVTLMAQLGTISTPEIGVIGLHIPARDFGPYGFGVWADPRVAGQALGPLGLSLAAGFAAWVEWGVLKRRLSARIGTVAPPAGPVACMTAAALVAGGAARGVVLLLPELGGLDLWGLGVHRIVEAGLAVAVFGAAYYGVGAALGLAEARNALRRVFRR